MKSLFILFFLSSQFFSQAEYGSIIIELRITIENGESYSGYQMIGTSYIENDSIFNTDYLLRVLQRWNRVSNKDTIDVFTTLIPFEKQIPESEETYVIYSFSNLTKQPVAGIEHLEVVRVIPYSYLIGTILNDLKRQDSIWYNKKPIQEHWLEGYLCSYEIEFYEENDEIISIFNELQETWKAYNEKHTKLESDLEFIDDKRYREAEKEKRELEDSIDQKLGDIASKLTQYKVIVVKSCTC